MEATSNDMKIEEREISLKEKQLDLSLKEKQLDLIKLEIEAKKIPERPGKLTPVTATIIAALIGLIGTGIVTIIQNANNNRLENEKFQSQLILKALESPDLDERLKSLHFMTALRLISNDSLISRLNSFAREQPQNIPYIRAATGFPARDELDLAMKGENAFENDSLKLALSFIDSAQNAQSSKVWETSLPFRIVAYWKLDRPQDAERNIQFMFKETQIPFTYLHHATPIGFLIDNFIKLKPSVPQKYQLRINEVVQRLQNIKRNAD